MPDLGVFGLFYWASAQAPPPLSRAIHSWQMKSIGGLFCTSNAPSARVGRAPDRDCTTSAHTWVYFWCSAYDPYCFTSRTYYIRAFHHHIGFGVSRPCAYLLDTHRHPLCSLLADGWDVCPSGPVDCYTPPDLATPGTSTSALARPSHIIRAFSSNWGYYSTWGHYHGRSPNSATSRGHYNYTRGCIISTWGSHYLIIGHLFILLYLYIILLEICHCFDAL